MRKIKQTITYSVPSWNFCNLDTVQANGRYSKELCRFCVKRKGGHHCMLYDKPLAADETFVYKPTACIKATAGYKTDVHDIEQPVAVPKLVMRETIKCYNKAVSHLMAQGYPRAIAEKVAEQDILNGK